MLLSVARLVCVRYGSVAVVVEPVELGFSEGECGRVPARHSPRGSSHAGHLIVVGEQTPHVSRQSPPMQTATRLRRHGTSIGYITQRRVFGKLL